MATGESLEQQLEARDPDVKLMLQVRDDVAGAFEALVERYQSRLLGIMVASGRPVGRSGGLDAGRFPADLQGPQGLPAAGEVLDVAVHDRQQPGAEPPPEQGPQPTVSLEGSTSGNVSRPADEKVVSRDATASAQMRKVELSQVVRDALDTLGEDQKMAVLLNKFEEMSYAEIAEVMGRTEPAVKSLLARARTNLRELLEPYLRTGQRGA